MDEALIRHIARLARIELGEAELPRLARDLTAIVGYFDKLKELDTRGVEPLLHAVEEPDRLAPDEPALPLGPEATLANAPRHDGAFFRVPRVVGGDS